MGSSSSISEMGTELKSVSASAETSSGREKTELDDKPIDDKERSIQNGTPTEEVDDDGEYPTGIRMAVIVVALALSIFLVRLPYWHIMAFKILICTRCL